MVCLIPKHRAHLNILTYIKVMRSSAFDDDWTLLLLAGKSFWMFIYLQTGVRS